VKAKKNTNKGIAELTLKSLLSPNNGNKNKVHYQKAISSPNQKVDLHIQNC
jgi:hypothetical protein